MSLNIHHHDTGTPESVSTNVEHEGTLACHFNKYNPDKYSKCRNHTFRTNSGVRFHFKRSKRIHPIQPPFCPTCKETFKTTKDRDEHIKRRPQTCQPSTAPDPEGITQDQWDALNRLGANHKDEKEDWYKTYVILFGPQAPRPASHKHNVSEFSEKLAKTRARLAPEECVAVVINAWVAKGVLDPNHSFFSVLHDIGKDFVTRGWDALEELAGDPLNGGSCPEADDIEPSSPPRLAGPQQPRLLRTGDAHRSLAFPGPDMTISWAWSPLRQQQQLSVQQQPLQLQLQQPFPSQQPQRQQGPGQVGLVFSQVRTQMPQQQQKPPAPFYQGGTQTGASSLYPTVTPTLANAWMLPPLPERSDYRGCPG